MAIFDIKKIFGGGGIKRRPEKTSTPSPKKEEKDSSMFGGKSYMNRGNFMHQLGNPELYRRTSLAKKDTTRIGEKLFGHGSSVKKKDVEEAEKQLNLGKWGKFKDLSYEDKGKAKRLTKGILGK